MRAFKSTTGCNIGQYIAEKQISKARHLLHVGSERYVRFS